MIFVRIVGVMFLALPGADADWRTDLLKEESIGSRTADLEKAIKGYRVNASDLERAYKDLGSEEYPERIRAQRRLLSGGPDALEWLRKLPKSQDPEVRIRVSKILDVLKFPEKGGRERMIRHAIRSLLDETGGKPSPATGGMFYEWFAQPAKDLDEGYRSFEFETGEGMRGEVADGHLILKGARDGDGDQRLVLMSGKWPGRNQMPKEFMVSAKMIGTEGGSGAWHLGISIGRVRALFHPGYNGGGFRFEEVGTAKYIVGNTDMGFTPSHTEWQQMRVRVRQMDDGGTELAVIVEQEGSPRFETSVEIPERVIGNIDQVGMDRSGRTGGDAMFDDLLIEFDE